MRYLVVILLMIFCLPAVTCGGYKEDFEKFREALAETVEHVQTNLLVHSSVAVPEA